MREATAWTTKNKDKADVSSMAKILRCTAEALEKLEAANKKRQGQPGRHRSPSLPQVGLWSRTMLSCGGRRRAPGTNIAIDNLMVAANLELETKIGDQMEDSALHSMWKKVLLSSSTLSIAENHRRIHGHEKQTEA